MRKKLKISSLLLALIAFFPSSCKNTSETSVCTALESITLPNGTTSISSGAFEGCTSLKSITIPDSVTTIGMFAFCACTSLESIIISKKSISHENIYNASNGAERIDSIDVFVNGSYEEEVNEILTTIFKYQHVYYLLDTQPTDTTHSYWYYDENNKPVKW